MKPAKNNGQTGVYPPGHDPIKPLYGLRFPFSWFGLSRETPENAPFRFAWKIRKINAPIAKIRQI